MKNYKKIVEEELRQKSNFVVSKAFVKDLIDHYEMALLNIPLLEKDINNWLYKFNVHAGICFVASEVFDADIYNSDFIKEITNGHIFVCEYPVDSKSIERAVKLLETRLQTLIKYLENHEDIE
jgi:hypothetical protein